MRQVAEHGTIEPVARLIGRLFALHTGAKEAAFVVWRGMAVIRCPCGNILGQRFGTYFCVRHQGREIVAREIVEIRCEDCGRVWQAEPPGERGAGRPDFVPISSSLEARS